MHSGHTALSEVEIEHLGVDPDGVLSVDVEDYQVEIDPPLVSLSEEQKGELPDPITTSRRFKCVPQILGLSSIHIFGLLFLPLSITFRRIHERNSFDLGAICLFCFKFCCSIDFLIPIVT